MGTQGQPYYFVDVFAEEPLTGNPLAVVTEADGLDDQTMRRIAREFNQSETTFLLSPTRAEADARLRSFTPSGAEVFGAGHNTLGAWWWLAVAGRLDLQDGKTELAQEIGDAVLSLEVVREAGRVISIGMRQSPPDFRAVVEDRDELAGALGLEAGDLDDTAARVVFTGVPHLLVPAADRATVDRAAPDAPRLAAALSAVEGQGCYLYCRDPIDADSAAYARFFNPTVGIWEDPATGSAAGPLGCQLVEQGVAEAGQAIIIEQGHAIGRPSRIQVTLDNGAPTVSGAGVVVAEGTLLL